MKDSIQRANDVHLRIDGKPELRNKNCLIRAAVILRLNPFDALNAARHISNVMIGSGGGAGGSNSMWRARMTLRCERGKILGQKGELLFQTILARLKIDEGTLTREAL